MQKQIDWIKECEKIAAEVTEEVIRKFFNNEEIYLLMRKIKTGDVYGLLARTPLNDEWNTVIIQHSVIPRNEIVLDKERLYKCALDGALYTVNHQDEVENSDFSELRSRIFSRVKWKIGVELQNIFSEIAVANPGKYPIKETHGHTIKNDWAPNRKNT